MTLSLNSNHFVSSIPTQFRYLTQIVQLNLNDNDLTGPIHLFYSGCLSLSVLDLSQNAFTGALTHNESSVFALPNITTLLLYSNCMHGSLPMSVCGARNLSVLVMDGLTSAPSCDFFVSSSLKPILEVYFLRDLCQGVFLGVYGACMS